jgi:hypothetical protein
VRAITHRVGVREDYAIPGTPSTDNGSA